MRQLTVIMRDDGSFTAHLQETLNEPPEPFAAGHLLDADGEVKVQLSERAAARAPLERRRLLRLAMSSLLRLLRS